MEHGGRARVRPTMRRLPHPPRERWPEREKDRPARGSQHAGERERPRENTHAFFCMRGGPPACIGRHGCVLTRSFAQTLRLFFAPQADLVERVVEMPMVLVILNLFFKLRVGSRNGCDGRIGACGDGTRSNGQACCARHLYKRNASDTRAPWRRASSSRSAT